MVAVRLRSGARSERNREELSPFLASKSQCQKVHIGQVRHCYALESRHLSSCFHKMQGLYAICTFCAKHFEVKGLMSFKISMASRLSALLGGCTKHWLKIIRKIWQPLFSKTFSRFPDKVALTL